MTSPRKEMTPRDRRLLELLAQGLANKAIAKKMGYKEGTTRVYLHQLYRRLGVAGKTAAVVWHVDQQASAARTLASAAPPAAPVGVGEESAGDFALRSNLFTALGAMSLLIGPYGRLWEVAARMKGERSDPAVDARRRRVRGLWEALLRGDFAHGKRLHDDPDELHRAQESPSEAVPLALLLWLGGYTSAAARASSRMALGKHGPERVSARDLHLLEAVRDVVDTKKADALERIHRVATDAGALTPSRHMAMAALFHAYAAHGDKDRARRTAQALWAEAESSRQHLLAMGERVFAQDVSLPRPATGAAAAERASVAPARDTVAAADEHQLIVRKRAHIR
jgi:DNA-binding CsgD family transcriptional regulator